MNQPTLAIKPETADDEFAAAIAAVYAFLDAEQAAQPEAPSEELDRWHASAKLSVQHLRPARTASPPRWSTIERLRRETGGSYGIVGL